MSSISRIYEEVKPFESPTYETVLGSTSHRPYALPAGPWILQQRWNELLFAHWPVPADQIAALLPPGVEVDTFDGYAWVGVVPFWMDEVAARVAGSPTVGFPTTRRFAELNLRTYVRSSVNGRPGVFFFSLDCESTLAVLGARIGFHLPYYRASMHRGQGAAGIAYRSRRRLTNASVRFDCDYRSVTGVPGPPSQPGSLAYFLTERYCLFTPFAGRMLVGHIHHLPWPLEPAEAEIRVNELPGAHRIHLPEMRPVLHFARELRVLIWPLRPDRE